MPFPRKIQQHYAAVFCLLFFVATWLLCRDASPRATIMGYEHNITDTLDSLAFPNDPIPRRDFASFAKYPAQNINEPSKHAYATLFCSRNHDTRDAYFEATQSLLRRLLWSPYRSKYPFIVFVYPFIPEKSRRVFRGQGAIVKEIELLDNIIPDEAIQTTRWVDVLSKLHLWKEVEWKKLVFLDSDAFPVRNIDRVFHLVQEQKCVRERLNEDEKVVVDNAGEEDNVCNYVYAGVLHYPPDNVNAGMLVLKPNLQMHARLMSAARKLEDYDNREMEQGVLKSKNAFALDGPFPVKHLPPIWNAFPEYYSKYLASGLSQTDGEVQVIHAKMWNRLWGAWNNFTALNDRWDLDWMSMCRFYDSESFVEARRTGIYDTMFN